MSAEGAKRFSLNLSGKRTEQRTALCLHFPELPYLATFFIFGGTKMEGFFEKIAAVNGEINSVIWGAFGLALLLGTGVIMTIVTKVFQVSHLGHWWKETIGTLFKKNSASVKKTDKKSISQFQALCTALAATVGTGNIAGVAAAST